MKMHEEIKRLRAEALAFNAGINDLKIYINSDKFHNGELAGYVSVKDIALRLEEIRAYAISQYDEGGKQ